MPTNQIPNDLEMTQRGNINVGGSEPTALNDP